MRRGEIWWAELPAPAGTRPVVLLSRDEAYPVRRLVTVAPVTTRVRRIASEVLLGPEDGLPRSCVVNLDTIITIAKDSLRGHIANLSQTKLRAVEEALHFALGLEW
ncbi:MAG: hypothetical protein C3F08_07235 [Candidatus Methylomirabilota bacterium]|nr:MAG: hypothetical protein C3F08_07235 [candidate division NC10 bacterium]